MKSTRPERGQPRRGQPRSHALTVFMPELSPEIKACWPTCIGASSKYSDNFTGSCTPNQSETSAAKLPQKAISHPPALSKSKKNTSHSSHRKVRKLPRMRKQTKTNSATSAEGHGPTKSGVPISGGFQSLLQRLLWIWKGRKSEDEQKGQETSKSKLRSGERGSSNSANVDKYGKPKTYTRRRVRRPIEEIAGDMHDISFTNGALKSTNTTQENARKHNSTLQNTIASAHKKWKAKIPCLEPNYDSYPVVEETIVPKFQLEMMKAIGGKKTLFRSQSQDALTSDEWRTHMLNVQVIYNGKGLDAEQKSWLGHQVTGLVNVLLNTKSLPADFLAANQKGSVLSPRSRSKNADRSQSAAQGMLSQNIGMQIGKQVESLAGCITDVGFRKHEVKVVGSEKPNFTSPAINNSTFKDKASDDIMPSPATGVNHFVRVSINEVKHALKPDGVLFQSVSEQVVCLKDFKENDENTLNVLELKNPSASSPEVFSNEKSKQTKTENTPPQVAENEQKSERHSWPSQPTKKENNLHHQSGKHSKEKIVPSQFDNSISSGDTIRKSSCPSKPVPATDHEETMPDKSNGETTANQGQRKDREHFEKENLCFEPEEINSSGLKSVDKTPNEQIYERHQRTSNEVYRNFDHNSPQPVCKSDSSREQNDKRHRNVLKTDENMSPFLNEKGISKERNYKGFSNVRNFIDDFSLSSGKTQLLRSRRYEEDPKVLNSEDDLLRSSHNENWSRGERYQKTKNSDHDLFHSSRVIKSPRTRKYKRHGRAQHSQYDLSHSSREIKWSREGNDNEDLNVSDSDDDSSYSSITTKFSRSKRDERCFNNKISNVDDLSHCFRKAKHSNIRKDEEQLSAHRPDDFSSHFPRKTKIPRRTTKSRKNHRYRAALPTYKPIQKSSEYDTDNSYSRRVPRVQFEDDVEELEGSASQPDLDDNLCRSEESFSNFAVRSVQFSETRISAQNVNPSAQSARQVMPNSDQRQWISMVDAGQRQCAPSFLPPGCYSIVPNTYGNQSMGYLPVHLPMGHYPFGQQPANFAHSSGILQQESLIPNHVKPIENAEELVQSPLKPKNKAIELKPTEEHGANESDEVTKKQPKLKSRKWRQCIKERKDKEAWWMPKDWAKQRRIGNYCNGSESEVEKKEEELQIAKDANIEQIRMGRFIAL